MDMQLITNMFVLAVPVLEKILRPIIVYVFLIVVLRLAGKRELAQLNPFDLVVLLTLSNTVQNAIIGNDNSVTGGLIGAATLLVVNYLVVRFLYSHRQLDEVVEGKADIIILNGKVNNAVMEREVITLAELESAARKQGYASLDEIQEAVLEPGGSISFSGKEPEPEVLRHKELISRIDSLSRELSGLRAELARK